jgi:riboflavin biosynthesis pyrimidine reductase
VPDAVVSDLAPLDVLFDRSSGERVRLPPPLRRLYGPLRFPRRPGRPLVVANFATTLDGAVTLGTGTGTGGAEITGSNRHDRLVMGILRAIADAVVVGAGTARSVPRHRWTAAAILPEMRGVFDELRRRVGRADPPLNVIVTASGNVDLRFPVFASGEVPVLIVTTRRGASRLQSATRPAHVEIAGMETTQRLNAAAILQAVQGVRPSRIVLFEGGPHLMGDFLDARKIDELFLTLAPQVAGRDGGASRLALVAGQVFAPNNPRWASLVSVRRATDLLFLRYTFATGFGRTTRRGSSSNAPERSRKLRRSATDPGAWDRTSDRRLPAGA